MALVYVLYSSSLDKYYVGATTLSISERLEHHNSSYYENKFTLKGIPWSVFWCLEVQDMKLATAIEHHIKKMKSRGYYQNLVKYPEIVEKLIEKYSS